MSSNSPPVTVRGLDSNDLVIGARLGFVRTADMGPCGPSTDHDEPNCDMLKYKLAPYGQALLGKGAYVSSPDTFIVLLFLIDHPE